MIRIMKFDFIVDGKKSKSTMDYVDAYRNEN